MNVIEVLPMRGTWVEASDPIREDVKRWKILGSWALEPGEKVFRAVAEAVEEYGNPGFVEVLVVGKTMFITGSS